MHWSVVLVEEDILLLRVSKQKIYIQLQGTKQANILKPWRRTQVDISKSGTRQKM